jgi:large subunit ribosomal protein L33
LRLGSRRAASGITEIHIMAKAATVLIRMVSTADTGYFYVKKKNTRTTTEKLELRKYDPRIKKHVLFKEAKIK